MTAPPPDTSASTPRRLYHAWRTKGWLRPFRNASLLAASGGAQGVLQLGAIALAAQALGAAGFGTLVLIDTARRFIGGLLRLRAKHVVIRYGARALRADAEPAAFGRVLSFSVWLDILSALIGLTAAVLAMGAAVRWLNMPAEITEAARLYSVCVVFVALSTSAEALLRLFDRFDLVASQNLVTPVIQLAGAALGLVLGAGLPFFLAVWFLAVAASRGTLIAAALWELHRRGRLGALSLHPRGLRAPEPGTWRFTLGTNALDSLTKLRDNGTVLAVGALLDPTSAGLVQVARKLGLLPGKPVSKILTPALLPEIARQTADAKHRKRRKTVRRSTAIAGTLGLSLFAVLALFGQTLLARAFGPEFAAAYPVMLLFGLGGVLRMLTFTMGPVLISAGRVRIMLIARIAMTAVQIGLLFVLIPHLGVVGTAMADVIAVLLAAAILVPAARRELRAPKTETPPP